MEYDHLGNISENQWFGVTMRPYTQYLCYIHFLCRVFVFILTCTAYRIDKFEMINAQLQNCLRFGSGRVGSCPFKISLVGLGWIMDRLLGWAGLGQEIWTHVHLCAVTLQTTTARRQYVAGVAFSQSNRPDEIHETGTGTRRSVAIYCGSAPSD